MTNASGVRASFSGDAAASANAVPTVSRRSRVDSVVGVGGGLVDRRRVGLGGDHGRRIFVFKLGSV